MWPSKDQGVLQATAAQRSTGHGTRCHTNENPWAGLQGRHQDEAEADKSRSSRLFFIFFSSFFPSFSLFSLFSLFMRVRGGVP